MAATNRIMAEKGMFSLELLEEMERYVEEYRSEHPEGQGQAVAPADGAR